MRRLSLKFKLTLLYTVLMTAVVICILTLLFSLSGKELLAGVQNQLEQRVHSAVEEIEYEKGELEFDSDLMNLEHGVYLSVYDADGILLYGKVPYDFDNTALFEDGSIRKYVSEDTSYYLMDFFYYIEDYGSVVVRGVTSITEAEASFRFTIHFAVILLPLMVILTAVTGYLMTNRTLRPVSKITDTVLQIQRDEDLSRRVSLGNGRDEIYRLSDTFDKMLEQIERSFERERRFASDVSHELRTPLAAMLLQCEELLKNEELETKEREGLQMIRQKAGYLSQMISQLLFLTRADQGRQKLSMEVLDFSELTELACDAARETAGDIVIEYSLQQGIMVRGDETLLIRFWMNLLQNAVTYGRPGGHVWVDLRKDRGTVKGEIRDDGIGISQADLPRIWERFYQADPSRSGEENSGLGLSMVKWITKVHHGKITVESSPGEGSVFSFSFPEADSDEKLS